MTADAKTRLVSNEAGEKAAPKAGVVYDTLARGYEIVETQFGLAETERELIRAGAGDGREHVALPGTTSSPRTSPISASLTEKSRPISATFLSPRLKERGSRRRSGGE